MKCILTHKWGKWIDKEMAISEHIDVKQIKYCKDCNLLKGRSHCYVKEVS